MAESSPTPPDAVPGDVAEKFDSYSVGTLRAVARYAETLAEHREQEAKHDDDERTDDERSDDERSDDDRVDDDGVDDVADDRPDEVPARATITVKEINDNRYYYWQWREGDTIKSKYKAPVSPDE